MNLNFDSALTITFVFLPILIIFCMLVVILFGRRPSKVDKWVEENREIAPVVEEEKPTSYEEKPITRIVEEGNRYSRWKITFEDGSTTTRVGGLSQTTGKSKKGSPVKAYREIK